MRDRPPNCLPFLGHVCMAVLLVRAALACTTPVYRYALERWEAEDYEAAVYHREALSDAPRCRPASCRCCC